MKLVKKIDLKGCGTGRQVRFGHLLGNGSTAGYMRTLSAGDWTVLLILGIIQIGAGYGFYNLGIQKISAQKASVIALWEMILGPVWVALFLKEYPTPLVLTGFIIILEIGRAHV